MSTNKYAQPKVSLPVSENLSAQPTQSPPTILWANFYCLLDTSSGASMAVREMLLQLMKSGFNVAVVGATIFDAPKGMTRIESQLAQAGDNEQILKITDGPITHYLTRTQSTVREQMTTKESNAWFNLYLKALEDTQPDIVYYYGGNAMDFLIPIEAKKRGIATVAYLVNGNYSGQKWCEDVDLILTDSYATAKMYRDKDGIDPHPIGAFIDPEPVIAKTKDPKNILLINPSLEKGGAVVVRIAMLLEKLRPDIHFEVVESRGNWHELVHSISSQVGEPRTELSNVTVTPNTLDMKPVFGRAKILLALSLWWDSFPRVVIESMMNGVPAIVSDHGGLPEAVGAGGVRIKFAEEFLQPPYNLVPNDELLHRIIQVIVRFYDDAAFYEDLSQKALKQGEQHKIELSTQRLINELTRLLPV